MYGWACVALTWRTTEQYWLIVDASRSLGRFFCGFTLSLDTLSSSKIFLKFCVHHTPSFSYMGVTHLAAMSGIDRTWLIKIFQTSGSVCLSLSPFSEKAGVPWRHLLIQYNVGFAQKIHPVWYDEQILVNGCVISTPRLPLTGFQTILHLRVEWQPSI